MIKQNCRNGPKNSSSEFILPLYFLQGGGTVLLTFQALSFGKGFIGFIAGGRFEGGVFQRRSDVSLGE